MLLLLQCMGIALLIYLLLHYLSQWAVSVWATKVAAKALAKPHRPSTLLPESLCTIHITEDEFSFFHPDGTQQSLKWSDLQKMEIITTSDGPLLPDRFWVLHGLQEPIIIPQGAQGDVTLLERLQKLPGFKNDVFIEAQGSTSYGHFTCWNKSPAEP
ncbi:hypothetical protein EI77_03873 [Prosthecobacter fusiformis]|uniref:Uncharacterized protein n=1 Tax=Prosthecobacter fusiformis TaxID=48464 RepID=A0A4R7RNG8_9BACT|nr:hypothetical protein [Prosthecobacter fusiformis]TDU66136.1 hypothetical protein EI77_03873 [Prosthecobacter fusiformis]